ncbi:Hpt domain-containing protein [Pseudomonas sp. LS44]|uniref:Hpt domain-containing protein n=1 Tax=Pseudomonas sp. LS44 TaxID=1357074 RepID=UPI00215B63D0|nr:Hpt domain-containing protein [Pseudomonas sp. LS44]UVE18130.1 Hpt domain-containing protein [Pseudomonas sp. LS44]
MGDRHDYVALEWVKGEIAETLKQARQALEAFVENPQDSTRMRFCLTYAHQVHGTLQMVEFFGAALLAEEMEHLAQALMEDRVSNQGEALEVLMQAILQLPAYLERIQAARRDLPLVILPLLNDLRAARGENLLSETSLFAPDIAAPLPQLSHESLAQLRTAELPVLLRKLRQMLQMALVGVIRNHDLATNLGYMARVFARLEVLCKDAPLGPLWAIASGMVEGLANGSVVNGASVRTLLRQVDKQLKRVVDVGADGINQAAPDELIKNLLFYVAKASAESPRIRSLKEQYRLDEALLDSAEVDEERARLAGPDRDAMRSVVDALCEELVRVKDSLDLFVRSDRQRVTELDGLHAPLKQIADTLAVLGFGQPRKVILDQLDVVQALSLGQREPSDGVLMDVAGALLYVEATLAGMVGPADDSRREESHLPTTDVAQIHQLVIKEARNGLEQAKDAIIEFIASQWNHEHLARVPDLLTQVRGGLAMIPLNRAAQLLNACNRYIQEQLLARKAVPNWHNLDTLADAITSVEYYLERLSEDHASQGDLILDVAEESLDSLGYPLKEKPSILDRIEPPAAVQRAPLADPLHDIEVLSDELEPNADKQFAAQPNEPQEAAAEFEFDVDFGALPELNESPSDLLHDIEVLSDEPESNTNSPFAAPLDGPQEAAMEFDLDVDFGELPTLSESPGEALQSLSEAPSLEQSGQLDDADELIKFQLDTPALAADEPLVVGALEVAPQAVKGAPESDDEFEFELDWNASEPAPLGEIFLEQPLQDEWQALDAASDFELNELSLNPEESGSIWDDVDLSEMDLPEVDLPSAPSAVASIEPQAKPLSVADVMAAPVQAINPPAQDVPPSLLPPPADEEPVDDELQEVFIEEVGEVLDTLGEYLPRWQAERDDKNALTEVRRAFHTLKGSGRMVRALIIGELAWSIENLLNRVLERSIEAGDELFQLIGQVIDLMPSLVDEFAAKAQRQRDDVDQLAANAYVLAKGESLAKRETTLTTEPDASAEDASIKVELPAVPYADDAEEALDPQLIEIFRNEAETHLDALVAFLADCAQELPQPVTDDLQRALHTLKGSASMAGILPIAEIATPLEKLVKEYKANLLPMDLAEAELLHAAEQLFRVGLEQLESRPLAPIPGAVEFLERAQQLHQDRLEAAEALRQGRSSESRDPQLISIFLAEGMDILLDAEDLLRRWHEHPSERQELSALLEELTTLGRGAEMADLPQIDELCEALLDLYGAVEEGRLAVSERFFSEAESAHEALIGMMDQVAAGLQVSAQPERVAALRTLLDEALDPNKLGLLSIDDDGALQIVELDDATAALDMSQWLVDEAAATPPLIELDEQDWDESAFALDEPAPLPPQSIDPLDEEMVAIFLEEAVDLLESAGQALERWLVEPDNQLALSSLQRDLHTLKGGARMAEISPIGDLAHELESLYEGLVDRRFSYSPALAILLQQSHDRLAVLLEQLQAQRPLDEPSELVQAMRAFRQGLSSSLPIAELPAQFEAELELEAEMPVALIEEEIDDADVATFFDTLESHDEGAAQAITPLEQFVDSEPEVGELTASVWLEDAEVLAAPDVEAVPEPLPVSPPRAEPVSLTPLQDDRDPELVEIFLEEGFDIIDSSSAALQRWMADSDNTLEVESLQRDLHTLKGGARMAEIREIGDLAHELEFLYEDLGNGRLRASPGLFELLQRCQDALAGMLEAVRAQRVPSDGQALIQAIRHFRANPAEQLLIPASVHLRAVAAQDDEAEADILDIFLEEGDELLEEMEASIGRWEVSRDDSAAIDDMLRVLHTLKGGARLAGQKRLGDLTHDLEQHLSEAQQQGAPWPESLVLDVQSGYEGLQRELDALRQRLDISNLAELAPTLEPAGDPVAIDTPAAPPALAPVPSALPLRALTTPIIAASQVPVTNSAAKVLPFVRRAQEAAQDAAARRAPQELVKVPADLLEGLVNLAGETSIFRGRVEQQVSDFGFTLSEMEATIDRVRDQLRRLDTETQAQILSRYQAESERAGYEDFDPLEMDRYSQLQQLSRALFESSSDLLDLKETLAARNRDAETLLLQQARVNTELQEGLMRTRMVPFDRLVPRLRRIVRQVASELGKQVEFVVGNADGEMDRTVLERIVAPLEHMLRNAVDHGIESAEARHAAGKPEQGTIRLNLGREGGDIVLSLSDDGGGIKLEAVRRKAIERGLMDADADLTDHEVLQFILEAGFSTAEKVTQISGRGVGMDVVHSEVKQLGGSMSIDSTLGEGTRFLIRLPFTVSVNRALMVLSGEDLYAIPLNTIEGIVRVSPYELEAYYQPDAPRFEYAGQSYELRYLGDLLNNGQHPKLVGQSLPLPVILVRSSEHAVAVQVDSLAGSREIVVKSLGAQFAGVHGISGATILGDGRVVVILDLLATIRVLHAHLQNQAQPRLLRSIGPSVEVEVERPTLVMVVDDSVTVRKVTSRLLERNGMNVLTAKDGVDAITLLQEHQPDIMLLDIEMPRMDGFEVAALVRHDERLKDLPIIMITSRTGEKHRERAMNIGVNEYLGKPYQESLLLETIAQLVARHPADRHTDKSQ